MISRRPKSLEDTMMNKVILTPNSSVRSTTTWESNLSETRDSFYFPGCRKDANCNCEICMASINATRDLMPQSIHRISLTKASAVRPVIQRSPISFASSDDLLTPKSRSKIRSVSLSPPLVSVSSLSFEEKVKRRKRKLGHGGFVIRLLLGLILTCGVEFGVSWMVSGLKSKLSPDLVKNLGENSWDVKGLKGRFMFLKNELEELVGNKVSSCSSANSVWKISQDGLLLNSRCVLYESMAEEVSIWGWPLQTSGLLTAEYSFRSFTILSGRVTEWSSVEANYSIWRANSSWTQGKWSSSVVQFDPNTWILEYKQRFLLNNAKPVSAAVEFLKFRFTREIEKLKKEIWLPSSAFGSQDYDFIRENIPIPT